MVEILFEVNGGMGYIIYFGGEFIFIFDCKYVMKVCFEIICKN